MTAVPLQIALKEVTERTARLELTSQTDLLFTADIEFHSGSPHALYRALVELICPVVIKQGECGRTVVIDEVSATFCNQVVTRR